MEQGKTRDALVRNIVFGVTDGVVSTVGLLAGIQVGGTARSMIILTGVVYAFVEGFSMAVGSFLSEESVASSQWRSSAMSGATMFVSFVVSSFIALLPYVVLQQNALTFSAVISLLVLFASAFLIGAISPHMTKAQLARHGAKMVVLGGAAIVIGIVVGKVFSVA